MHLLHPLNIAAILTLISSLLLPHLTTCAPADTDTNTDTNTTISEDPTKSLILSISPARLEADECPTPPTEFLPYPPPPGYTPGPGCPPASEGTQPSEFNPPPGFYGGTGSGSGGGSGSSPEYSSQAGGGLRGRNWFDGILGLRGGNPFIGTWDPFRCIWGGGGRAGKLPERALWRRERRIESEGWRGVFWRKRNIAFTDVLPGVYWPMMR